ncbi:hypothetical protein EDC96DRAFT_611240 [Choanephora cucurbitarum]|nr:hypothetical protein EDC96DRAFT_611240 [Choanephora cucurbitarum]
MFSQDTPSTHLWHENELEELRKAIREQKLVLDTLTDVNSSREDIEDIKQRILSISRELHTKQSEAANRGRLTQSPAQWWSRYQLNVRQLEAIADERRALEKEIDYLIHTSIRNLEHEIQAETDKLSQFRSNPTESERIRAKAQAMVAARLNKAPLAEDNTTHQLHQLMDQIKQNERDIQSILERDLAQVDHEIDSANKELREQQMFEKGLYVDDQLAQWINTVSKTYDTPKKAYPPLPRFTYSSSPPPIPTSQRPGTPRSEADIKAEAHRRIEERRRLFMKETKTVPAVPVASISQEEKNAQERMRQAEAEARARLETMREKRNRLRRETEEAEERKRQAAEAAAAAAEAEMLAEKKRQQQQEEARLAAIQKEEQALAEQQKREREQELYRLRLEKEAREQQEAEERKLREERERVAEEERQRKAREAAEQAAHEKRMRRIEIERRERELQAARQEEIDRRRQWEQQQREEEERLIRLEEEARLKKIREEEEARLAEEKRLEEQRQIRRRKESELRKKREEEEEKKKRQIEERRRLEEEAVKRRQAEEMKRQAEERKRQAEERRLAEEEEERSKMWLSQISSESQYATSPASVHSHLPNSTTAGTSGYGVDVEDEVNFSTIYRVNTLYDYHGIREDDLSFSANETLKAHPSKDKASDWWYGTSLKTNQMGFFPRTYVEVVEEAFRVRTLYEFRKSRDDDLGFAENEVILVQPFQDENSDWWYGTNEETKESGYFPKTYVEKITPASTQGYVSPSSLASPVAIPLSKNASYLGNDTSSLSDHDIYRGLSAPNTPIMKKTNLSISKTELTKRRRAASSVSTSEQSRIGTPQLILPQPDHVSENLELLTWASTMDPIELDAIPSEERKRQEAIFELIATERTYLSNLQMIVNVFYTESGKYLSQDERDVVFSNIDDLLICNTALLSDMETRQREQANVIDKIGDIFLQHANGLKCYSSYCRNQSYATKFLQKKREEDQWFEVFLKTAQTRPECRSLDLSHYLLQPVQRITRYPLLLRQILNSTPKKHPDHSLVRSSLSMAQRVLEDVNEETRRYENKQKILELSRILDMESIGRLDVHGREFVMDSPLFKTKSGRKLHGFLFNDILILAEPLKSLSPKGYLYTLYREPMPLEKISVRQQQTMTMKPSFGSNSNTDDLSFQIVTGTHVTAVKTSTVTLKKQWMSQIQHYSALQQYK